MLLTLIATGAERSSDLHDSCARRVPLPGVHAVMARWRQNRRAALRSVYLWRPRRSVAIGRVALGAPHAGAHSNYVRRWASAARVGACS